MEDISDDVIKFLAKPGKRNQSNFSALRPNSLAILLLGILQKLVLFIEKLLKKIFEKMSPH